MKTSPEFTTEESGRGKTPFSEAYSSQSRRPSRPVPVFHGKKRYKEAEEEE